jgi:hypothetical protein
MLQIDDVVTGASTQPRLEERSRVWPVLALGLAPFVGLAIWRAFQGFGVRSDDFGQYLMHAQALADGRPYGDIAYIYSKYARFIGPRLAPPGLPVTLAPLISAFGPNMVILKAMMLLFGVAFVAYAGLYFTRFVDRKLGIGVALLCALSPSMVHAASQILTDLPFAALLWILIYLIDRPGRFDAGKIIGVTLIGAYAVTFRSTGVALGPALLLFALLHYREHGIKPFVPLAVWGGGLAILALFTNVGGAAVVSVHPKAIFEWIFIDRLPLYNISQYAQHMVASHTYPFPWDIANDVFHVLTVALMVVGLAAWLPRNYKRFAVIFAASYLLMLIILPITQPRYLWPLFPFFVFGLLNGVRVSVEWLTRAPRLAASGALAAAILLVPPATLNVINDPRPIDLTDVAEVRDLFDYLEQRADTEQLRVTFFKPRTLGWLTGIPTMGPPRGQPHCILGELGKREITHVITGSLWGDRNSYLRATIQYSPERFQPQYQNGLFTVYAFQRGPDALTFEQNPECRRR